VSNRSRALGPLLVAGGPAGLMHGSLRALGCWSIVSRSAEITRPIALHPSGWLPSLLM